MIICKHIYRNLAEKNFRKLSDSSGTRQHETQPRLYLLDYTACLIVSPLLCILIYFLIAYVCVYSQGKQV